ncbi:MAG: hypothetical protein AB8B72_13960 [Crocinitomicaceae bacterium]
MKQYLLSFFVLCGLFVNGQGYKQSIGLRSGFGSYGPSIELSYRIRPVDFFRIELNSGASLLPNNNDLMVGLHAQYIIPIGQNVNYYIGLGYQYSYAKSKFQGQTITDHTLGLSGMMGRI